MVAKPPFYTTQGFSASIDVAHGTSTETVDVYLLVIAEGLAPRALLFFLVRLPQEGSSAALLDTISREIAHECTQRFLLPIEWSSGLQDYFRRRVIFTTHSVNDFNNTVALGHSYCSAAVAQGHYTQPVWDLCSGREMRIGALQPRCWVYANSITSLSDVALSTRFVRNIRLEGEDMMEVITHLIRELTFVRDGGHELIHLEAIENGFLLEYEASVQKWLTATTLGNANSPADQQLAHVLIKSLNLRSDSETLQGRIRALREHLAG